MVWAGSVNLHQGHLTSSWDIQNVWIDSEKSVETSSNFHSKLVIFLDWKLYTWTILHILLPKHCNWYIFNNFWVIFFKNIALCTHSAILGILLPIYCSLHIFKKFWVFFFQKIAVCTHSTFCAFFFQDVSACIHSKFWGYSSKILQPVQIQQFWPHVPVIHDLTWSIVP